MRGGCFVGDGFRRPGRSEGLKLQKLTYITCTIPRKYTHMIIDNSEGRLVQVPLCRESETLVFVDFTSVRRQTNCEPRAITNPVESRSGNYWRLIV